MRRELLSLPSQSVSICAYIVRLSAVSCPSADLVGFVSLSLSTPVLAASSKLQELEAASEVLQDLHLVIFKTKGRVRPYMHQK